jgi:hypothetical protein
MAARSALLIDVTLVPAIAARAIIVAFFLAMLAIFSVAFIVVKFLSLTF